MSLKSSSSTTRKRAVLGEPQTCDINSARLATVSPGGAASGASRRQLTTKRATKRGQRPVPHTTEEKAVQTAPDIPTMAVDSRARDRELIGLLEQIAQGEQAALGTLYDTTNRVIYGFVPSV